MINFAFFGTSDFSVIVLEELASAGFSPSIIVTETDKPKGRGLLLTPPPVKTWAEAHSIPVLQPPKLDSDFIDSLSTLNPLPFTLFLVASYGKILPKSILDIPRHGTLNVHPSLLPKYRGPSPIQTAILNGETQNGITIMLMDEKMDHGPIVAQETVEILPDSLDATQFELRMARAGGKLLAKIIPDWLSAKITTKSQDDADATYSKKISKKDGLLILEDSADTNYRKYLALKNSVSTYFLTNTKTGETRVKIVDATKNSDRFVIETVIPENKKSMSYQDFLRGI